jgi:hypothetical protein
VATISETDVVVFALLIRMPEIDHRSAKRAAASRQHNARKFELTASDARLAKVAAFRRSWLEKRSLGLADGRSITIVTGRGGRKLLRQGSVRKGQLPRRGKHAAVQQKSTAIWFRWSIHEHDQCDQTSASPQLKILLPIVQPNN